MSEEKKSRRELKREITLQVKKDKEKEWEKKEAIKQLPEEERRKRLKELREEKRQRKRERKEEIKSLPKKERRRAKRADKIYRKIKNRPRRFTLWTIVAVALVFLAIQVAPTVSNLASMLSGKEITVDSSSPEAKEALAYGDSVSLDIAREGIVLLKNEDKHLPLEEKRLNVFGIASFDFRHGGGGSGSSDASRAVSLYEGLSEAGIEYNENLYELYQEEADKIGISSSNSVGIFQVIKALLGRDVIDEPEIDHLTEDHLAEAKDYSDNALIVISSAASEAADMELEELRLTENKRALVEKVAENFDNVTIVVNAGNAMELGFVEELPSIKSVLWLGTPGPYGPIALGETLVGDVNPSGRLTDTYVYDNASAPGSENFGEYKYDNLNYGFINYQEGIYVGYRFYETYFEDDEEGYKRTVLYPYGHGLSYTDFSWELIDENMSEEKIELSVRVTNEGDLAGKDVVQLYYAPPYIDGGIEKSAIELAAFAKTALLDPGESEILSLSFNVRDMASYDMKEEEAYVLDKGDYELTLNKNVHESLLGTTYSVTERRVYEADEDTQTPYKNHFDFAQGDFNYLSRNQWDETYPSDQGISYEASEELISFMEEGPRKIEGEIPNFGVDNGLSLEDLKGVDYDDPIWDDFLDQLTLDDMIMLVSNAAYKTEAIERLGIPKSLLMDGPAGFSYFFKQVEAAAYPTEVVIASTWNTDLAYKMGESVGKEARAYGIQGWYAPGLNLHRTAQGGRNFEYFSEDPYLTGKMSAAMTKGAQEEGIIVFMKHYALNDQETNARSGVVVWANEQAIRELYLKPFEMTVKEADVLGVMSSFSMVGGKWAGANEPLLEDILRQEWGFEGFVTSDAVFGFMKAPDAITAGNEVMLDILTPKSQEKLLKKAYEEDPVTIGQSLRRSVHRVLSTLLETYLFE